jgi:transcriptional regulator with XRE-family HTH domain
MKNTNQNQKNNLNTIGERVKWMRKAKGWNQPELAQRCGVTYQNIQNLETGKTSLPRYLRELANSLETTIEYLMNGEQEPNVVRVAESINLVVVDNPIEPNPLYEYHIVKIQKGSQLFLPAEATKVATITKILISHNQN